MVNFFKTIFNAVQSYTKDSHDIFPLFTNVNNNAVISYVYSTSFTHMQNKLKINNYEN